jgi:dihydropyrimidinase
MDLVIRNGTLVDAHRTIKADIGIQNGVVKAVGNLEAIRAKDRIDAEGKYVFPGIIDVHNHIDHVGGAEKTKDDFFQGTRGAAFGGVTTLMDFAMQKKDETVPAAIKHRRAQADGKVCIDYGLHGNITNLDDESRARIPELIAKGYSSFKLFMTYRKAGFIVEDPVLYEVMQTVCKNNGMVGIHAENDTICEYLTDKYVKEGMTSAPYHALSRPNIAEAECISRAILFAEHTDSALYVFHLTTHEGVQLIRDAKRRGVKVYAETCPHYLTLTEEVYGGDDAQNFIMTPPLRKKEDIEALWEGIQDRTISIVSSDHCCFTTTQKKIRGDQSFRDITPGIPGNETLLPILHQYGVNIGRISVNRMIELLSYNPARLFGLQPEKGSLDPGADADVVIFDPDKKIVLDNDEINMETDYTPYAGMAITGYPVTTISKGKVIVSDGVFMGEEGAGRFIERKQPDFF